MGAGYSRACRSYIFLMLGLFPLLGGDYSGITARKSLLFLLISACFLLALLLEKSLSRRTSPSLSFFAAAAKGKGFSPGAALRRLFPGGAFWHGPSFSLFCWLLLAVSALLSSLLSPYRAQCWLGSGRSGGLLFLLLYLLLGWLLSRSARLEKEHIFVLAFSTLLMNGIALLQLAGGNPLGLYPAGLDYYDAGSRYAEAFLGSIGNLNQLGGFYCLSLPLLLGQARLEKRPLLRWLLLGCCLLSCAVAVLARMEACCLGLLCGLLLSLPGLSARPWLRRQLLACLLALGLVLLAYGLLFPGPVGSSWWQFHRLLLGMGRDEFGSMRLGIWRVGWELISQRPVLGWGADVLCLAYRDLFPPGALLDAVHNEYLAFWLDAGLPGLLAYMTALLSSLIRWFRRSLSEPCFLLPFAMGCAYAVQAFFSFSTPIVAPLWWLLWGLALGMERQAEAGAVLRK
ncbi:MAG: O-antigen ligase family protein [Bacillota bacterium]|nr:O-antigen ligase family protein [Bacillota bacterium]